MAAVEDLVDPPVSLEAEAGENASSSATSDQIAAAVEETSASLEPSASVTKDLQDTPTRSGLAATMSSIFGEYTPRTYQVVTETDGASYATTEVVPGLAGLDWPYLCGVVLFSIMLLGLYKLMGVVLR